MDNIWRFIEHHLSQSQNIVLGLVTGVEGSSPGKPGFKMAIARDGTRWGSIGGGIMEYKLEKMALEWLEAGNRTPGVVHLVHNKEAGEAASGLICAGSQTHVFVPLNAAHLPEIKQIIQAQEEEKDILLQISAPGVFVKPVKTSVPSLAPVWKTENEWQYEEVIRPPDTLYIFGGGHISLPLSKIGRLLGFRVVILDNRQDLPSMKENRDAHQKLTISLNNAAQYIQRPQSSYVAILTASHQWDQTILEQMLQLPLRYLGMIGSRAKVRQIFDNLMAKGHDASLLNQVDSPMGISIGSETTEEIAVSIAGAMIRKKRGWEAL